MDRPTIRQVCMRAAQLIAERSTCSRLSVGAVVATERGTVVSWGYNGPLSGQPPCDHRDAVACQEAVHAEANAIYWAARRGIATEGTHLFVTHMPCINCAKAIVQAGIIGVIYLHAYRDTFGWDLLINSGIYPEQIAVD